MRRHVCTPMLLIALASCGDGGPSDTAFSGSVHGIGLRAPTAVFDIRSNTLARDQLTVLVSDDPDACSHVTYIEGEERPYLKMPDGSHAPSLWLKMTDHSPVLADLRGIGDDLHASFDPGAPAGDPCGSSACQARWLGAVRGSSQIIASGDPSDTDARARGTFHLDFGDGNLVSGDFDAMPCKALKAEGCSAAGGGLAPLFGVLAGGVFFRRRSSDAGSRR